MDIFVTFTDFTGILGDTLTFAGSIVLTADAVRAVAKFRDEQLRLRTIKLFAGRIRLETKDGHPLQSDDDVHVDTLRNLAFWAKVGATLLICGFAFQLVTRVVEITNKP